MMMMITIKAGASGYLMKHEAATVLHEAVMNVLDQGGAPMNPAIARKALQLLIHSGRTLQNNRELSPSIITKEKNEKLHVQSKAQVIQWRIK